MSDGTAVQPFDFRGRQVRTVVVDDEPWFVAADICQALSIGNVSDALTRLDGDDIGETEVIDKLGRKINAKTVSEPGLYELVIRSNKPEAREFKRWVTHEVLPAIRKTGSYVTPAVDDSDPLMRQALMNVEIIRRQQEQQRQINDHNQALLELGARTERLEAGYERLAATGYANLRGLRHDVAYLNRLGRAAANIARRDGVTMEKAHSTIFGTVNAWPVAVWDEALTVVGG